MEQLAERPYIKGEIIHLIFHNEENFYTVALVKVLETTEPLEEKKITVVGTLPNVDLQEIFLFHGQLIKHPRFGLQYKIEQFSRELPKTAQGVVRFLSSDRFPGIGKRTAEAIVDVLGEQAITEILADHTILEKVPKLSKEKEMLIYEQLLEHQGIEQVIMKLSPYGFGVEMCVKIFQTYGNQTLHILDTNPYQLITDVEGIGFKRADMLGESIGISGNHPDRIQAGCLFLIQELCMQEGHVFLSKNHLIPEVIRLLSNHVVTITEEEVDLQLLHLEEEGKLVREEERIYENSLFYAEKGIVNNLSRILKQKESLPEYPEAEFLKAIGEVEESLKITYAPSQKEAIQQAIKTPVMLLTGGPGTGKTTVINGIIEVFAKLSGVSLNIKEYGKDETFPVLLVAPTGRAAKRMGEATGLPATTIHRLLGWKGANGGFEKDEYEPLEGSLIIIDEVSMVDIWLANQLLKSIPKGMQVVFVGDQDQLPSVGPGQVLRDFLDANAIPTVALTDIYRQAEGSSIIQLAHSMKDGELPDDLLDKKNDRRFFPCDQYQVVDVVKQVCASAVKKGYSAKDIQVLAPMYRGDAGIEKLNVELQLLFNPAKDGRRELTFADTVYRTGDVVLQLVNNPDEQVYNGDRGEIVAIFYARENTEKVDQLVVSFDGKEVVYQKKDLNQITLAYCTSIHKAQGSEFPIVVMPVVNNYWRMLRRNLIYTGVTRAKDYLILCGELSAIERAVAEQDDGNRNSMLAEKLKQHLLN
ncbi:MAG TPA: ATP-dependent RecD-like DNA helicase [Bacilli bacterium]|nr:ATP-dependent RecD-like DNA helicase [Bacilli bacterium]